MIGVNTEITSFVCPSCASKEFIFLQKYKSKTPFFENMGIYQCKECKLDVALPQPKDLSLKEYYSAYWHDGRVSSKIDTYRMQADSRFKYLSRYLYSLKKRKLHVLDVGSGYAFIGKLFNLHLNNLEVVYDCIEMDPVVIEFLEGQDYVNSIFKSIDEIESKYDLILLSHLIEHLTAPLDFLDKNFFILEKNGLIFVEVPNLDYTFKVVNEPHLLFFNPVTLQNLIRNMKCEILDVGTFGQELTQLQKSLTMGRSRTPKAWIKSLVPKKIKKTMKQLLYGSNIIPLALNGQWIRLIAKKID